MVTLIMYGFISFRNISNVWVHFFQKLAELPVLLSACTAVADCPEFKVQKCRIPAQLTLKRLS